MSTHHLGSFLAFCFLLACVIRPSHAQSDAAAVSESDGQQPMTIAPSSVENVVQVNQEVEINTNAQEPASEQQTETATAEPTQEVDAVAVDQPLGDDSQPTVQTSEIPTPSQPEVSVETETQPETVESVESGIVVSSQSVVEPVLGVNEPVLESSAPLDWTTSSLLSGSILSLPTTSDLKITLRNADSTDKFYSCALVNQNGEKVAQSARVAGTQGEVGCKFESGGNGQVGSVTLAVLGSNDEQGADEVQMAGPSVRYSLMASWTSMDPQPNSQLLPGHDAITIHGSFDSESFYSVLLTSEDQTFSVQSGWIAPQSSDLLQIQVPVPDNTWYQIGTKMSVSVSQSTTSQGDNAQVLVQTSPVQYLLGASFFSVTSTTGAILTPTVSQLHINGSFNPKANYACQFIDVAAQRVALLTGYTASVDNGHTIICNVVADLIYVAGNDLSVDVLEIANPLSPNPSTVYGNNNPSPFKLSAYWTSYSDISDQPTPNHLVPSVTRLQVSGSFLTGAYYACAVEVNGEIQIQGEFGAPESDLASVKCQIPTPFSQYVAGPGASLRVIQADNALGSNPTKIISKPVLPVYLDAFWSSVTPASNMILTPGVSQVNLLGSFDTAKFYRGVLTVQLQDQPQPLILQAPWTQPTDLHTVSFKFPPSYGYPAGTSASFDVEVASSEQGQDAGPMVGTGNVGYTLGAYFFQTDLQEDRFVSPRTTLTITGSFHLDRYYLCQMSDPTQNNRMILSSDYSLPLSESSVLCQFSIGSVDWKAGSAVQLSLMEAEDSRGSVGVHLIGQVKTMSFPLQSYWLSSSCSSGNNVNPGSTTVLVAGSLLQDKYYACALLDPTSGQLSVRSEFVQAQAGGTAVTCVVPNSDAYTAGTHELQVFESSNANGDSSETIFSSLRSQYFVSATWASSLLSSGQKIVPTNTTVSVAGNFVNGYWYGLSVVANGQTVTTEFQQVTTPGRTTLYFVVPLIGSYMSGDTAQISVMQKTSQNEQATRINGPDPQFVLKDHVGPIAPMECLATLNLNTTTSQADLAWSPWSDPHSQIVGYSYSAGSGYAPQGLVPPTHLGPQSTSAAFPVDFANIDQSKPISVSFTAVNSDGTESACVARAFLDGTRAQQVFMDRVAEFGVSLPAVNNSYMHVQVPPALSSVMSGVSYRVLSSDELASNPHLKDPSASAPGGAAPKVFSGITFTMGGMDDNGGMMSTMALPAPVSLTIHFGDLKLDADRVGTLSLYLFDEEKGEWKEAAETCPHPQQHIDSHAKTITVDVCHFTQFAVYSNGYPRGWSVDLIVGLAFFGGALAVFGATSLFWSKKKRAARRQPSPQVRAKADPSALRGGKPSAQERQPLMAGSSRV